MVVIKAFTCLNNLIRIRSYSTCLSEVIAHREYNLILIEVWINWCLHGGDTVEICPWPDSFQIIAVHVIKEVV